MTIEQTIAQLPTEQAAQALSALTAEAKKRAARLEIDALLPGRAQILSLLSSDDPKTRKNAARLIGALGHAEDAPSLADALAAEETRFVVPSLLLSLGSVGGDAARAALAAYAPPAARDETEQKHCREIAVSLQKARAALDTDAPLPVYTLDCALPTTLCAPAGMEKQLREELAERRMPFTPHPRGASVKTDSLAQIYAVRTMAEPIIELGTNVPAVPEQIAAVAKAYLTAPYRIELREYEGDRAAFIRALSDALGGGDNPSRYALELRVECGARALCAVSLVPMYPADARFSYRKRALPASIAPPLAAALARMGLSAVKAEKPRVLDPFCGSGTLLFECERLRPCTALIGVDHAKAAVLAARENGLTAHSSVYFVQKDCLRFSAREPFDLVLSNLPFGNRVGSHDENEYLYAGFLHRLPELLADGGAALLYTMEMRLLSACLKREKSLLLVSETRTSAGGLTPRAFLVRKG